MMQLYHSCTSPDLRRGRWAYDARYGVIEDTAPKGWKYNFRPRLQSTERWIAHMAEKTAWVSEQDLFDLEELLRLVKDEVAA